MRLQLTDLQHKHAPGDVITEACADNRTASTGVAPHCFFYFARFPEEIQLAVVEATLVSDQPIVDLEPRGINLAFLQTCKRVHDEGTKILFTKNTFHFTDLSILLERVKPGTFWETRPYVRSHSWPHSSKRRLYLPVCTTLGVFGLTNYADSTG